MLARLRCTLRISQMIISFLMIPPAPRTTLFPYTTLFRSKGEATSEELDLYGIQPASQRMHPVEGRSEDSINERSEEHTSELQSLTNLVCRLLLEKKKQLRGLPP